MKVNILLLLAVTLGAARAAPASAPAAVAPTASTPPVASSPSAEDPCRPIAADPAACRAGAPLCAAPERVRIACELREVVEARYVFFEVKRRLLAEAGRDGFDARRHLDACVEAERAVVAEDQPLRFYDRMRRCTAAFEDGHLLLRVPGGAPQVALGVGLRLAADGKVYVASRAARLAALAERGATPPDAASLLSPGSEVVEVDGRPVREVLDGLAAFLPGGSPAARRERAVDALTRRDFAYPERPVASLTVSSAGETRHVELPWWIAPGAEKNDLARAYVRRTGIATTDLLDWREARASWGGEPSLGSGLRRGDTILPPSGMRRLQEYAGDGGLVAARLGETAPADADAQPFCYAQFVTFHTETLSAGGVSRPFLEVVEAFLRDCGARGLDLVLDLRQNEGGYISHSTALARMLLPREATSPGGALVLRATAFNERVYRERAPMIGGAPRSPPGRSSEPERVLASIREARRAGEEFTPAFVEAPLEPDPEVGGFEGGIVALVTPSCMSACERLAGLLRSGGRAVLVGEPTEGAGGSQQETKDLSARWTDRTGRLSLSIPNAAMGVLPAGDGARDASAERFFDLLAFENRPVVPHVRYATTLDDLLHGNRGWLEQVEAARALPAARVR
jgi:hypothetical protein